MSELSTEVLEQYELNVIRTGRGRGAVLCETDRGLKLLKECGASEARLAVEDRVKTELGSAGLRLDAFVRNREGAILSREDEGPSYTLRDWFEGRECSAREDREMLSAAALLARFHRAARDLRVTEEEQKELGQQRPLSETMERHNRELRRARRYIRRTAKKTEFELCVLRTFEHFYAQAEQALFLWQEAGGEEELWLCHGDFTHHHVLIDREGPALVELSRMCMGSQVGDLYQFLRKMLEKNNWSLRLGDRILAAYEQERPLAPAEWRSLYVRFLYPEKYWKQINYYFNSNKAWLPGRNTGKLEALERQWEGRQQFLEWLRRQQSRR